MPEKPSVNVFWFRRDLRLDDNHGLSQALQAGLPVLPIFIFDRNILDKLQDSDDARVGFIHQCLIDMDRQLTAHQGGLLVIHDTPQQAFKQITQQYRVEQVFCNHDYEPYANTRDQSIKNFLKDQGVGFKSFKDQVIFEKEEVVKDDGKPYTVFTPFMRKWRTRFEQHKLPHHKLPGAPNFFYEPKADIPSLGEIGFNYNPNVFIPPRLVDLDVVHAYDSQRDFPALVGTSRLGIHLRFGTFSIRRLVTLAKESNQTYLNELIWREFYMMILWHFPHVVERAFKPAYDLMVWRNDPQEYALWQEGKTGYPLVDAGMRELNRTGYMHNRVRMVVASFLCKHLLIDWRWGEAYFAQKLLDFELASNNGGWQWAAGTGCDAAPYFRVFNPTLQAQKFDADQEYIKKWVPEVHLPIYPRPVVEHSFARKRAIKTYKSVLNPVV